MSIMIYKDIQNYLLGNGVDVHAVDTRPPFPPSHSLVSEAKPSQVSDQFPVLYGFNIHLYNTQDVDMMYLAKITKGFSGADLTEVCQRVGGLL